MPPAPGQINPTALPARIVTWLQQNPPPGGAAGHRARDVANGLGLPADTTQAAWSANVGRALSRLVGEGSVVRTYADLGYKAPVGLYAATLTRQETTP